MKDSILARIVERARDQPGQPALIQILGPGRTVQMSFAQLDAASTGLALRLERHRIKSGDRFAILMRRSLEHVVSMLAALKLGATFFSINDKASLPQIDQLVRSARAAAVIFDNSTLFRLAQIEADQVQSVPLLHFCSEEMAPSARACMQTLRELRAVDEIAWGDAPAAGDGFERPSADPAFAIFTSGSTGRPKGVAVSQEDFSKRVAKEVASYGLSHTDRLLSLSPFSFDVGLNQLFSSLVSGATLVILNSWLARDYCNAISDFSITGVSWTPYFPRELLRLPETEARQALTRLRYFAISGGDLAEAQLRRLRALAGDTAIFKTYGQTETFRSTMLLPHELDAKMTSVGRPIDGVRVLVVDAQGSPVPSGTTGEIVHGGPGTMMGYLDDPGLTATKIRSPGSNVYTGDRGRLDADGYLYVLGRMDQMVKVREQRVYPQEIADVLQEHPGVEECVALGAPVAAGDDNEIRAAVRLAAGATVSEQDLRQFAARRLPNHLVPARIVVLPEFPRTASRKVDLQQLRERLE